MEQTPLSKSAVTELSYGNANVADTPAFSEAVPVTATALRLLGKGLGVFATAFVTVALISSATYTPREVGGGVGTSLYAATANTMQQVGAQSLGSVRYPQAVRPAARAPALALPAVADKEDLDMDTVQGLPKRTGDEQEFASIAAELSDPEAFKASPAHKFWCGAHAVFALTLLAKGLITVTTPMDGLVAAAATLAAYILADLGTGIFHWSVDNYGDKNTPIWGGVIDSFQGHHRYPWTIVKREWQNNVHMVAKPVAWPTAIACLLPLAPVTNIFLAFFSTFVVYSQQFHAWSHMKGREMPPVVLELQERGILVSRRGHGQHHKPPFKNNYCIVSGLWNELLDGSGFFPMLEKIVYKLNGAEARSWRQPSWKVQQEAPANWGK